MNSYKLQILKTRLKSIIVNLNKDQFLKLDDLISGGVKAEAHESLQKWYRKLPKDLVKEFYSYENIDDIPDYLKESYSIPFLHLDDNLWALAFFSKNIEKEKYNNFIKRNGNKINKLSSAIDLLESYDVDGYFTDKQKDQINKAKAVVKANAFVINEAEDLLKSMNTVYSFSNVKKDMRRYQNSLAKLFYQTDKKSDFLLQIEYRIQNWLKDIDMTTIQDIQERIKKVWQELKKISLARDVQITNNLNIQNLFADLPHNVKNVFYQFNNLQDIVNISDQEFRDKFHLSYSEIQNLKGRAQQIIEIATKSAYPHLNRHNLTPKELELLSLIKEYKDYPSQRDEHINSLKEQLNQIEDKIDNLDFLAKNRKLANLLNDEEFNRWVNLEDKIYKKFDVANKLYKKIKQEKPTKEENKDRIQQDYQRKSADYMALIENITGEKETVKSEGDLPTFIIDAVKKIPLNLDHLKATLRPYQKFAAQYILKFKNVLLGDEMGLGKTLESLTVANHLYQKGKKYTIAVGPFSVVTNWKQEIKNKTDLPVFQFHGSTGPDYFKAWKQRGGVLLTNYEQCQKILELDPSFKIDFVIIDEAHNIKNETAQRTIAAKQLLQNSTYKLLMTGTPLENKLNEMNSLISILNPRLGYELAQTSYIGKKEYKRTVATVYLRRKRKDVLKELPLINMIESWSKFNTDQQDYYDKAVMAGESGFQRMRRAAFIGRDSEKIEQIQHICEDARDNDEKVLIFSFFKEDVIFKLQKLLPHVASHPITGDIRSSEERQKIIDEFSTSPDESVLICQINAAGLGLNIQAASQVILCEPSMKPSTENQAISRVYRMGQTHNVTVYHLLTENSIDETIMNKLQYKQKLFDKYANDSFAAEMMQKVSLEDNVAAKHEKQSSIKKQILQIEQSRLAQRRQLLDRD